MDFLNLSQNGSSKNNNSTFSIYTDKDEDYFNYDDCHTAHSVNFWQFIRCFKYFLSKSILVGSLVILFSISTAILNVVIIIFINKLKRNKTVFDKIFIGHAFVDFLVGVLVIPNYCIYTMFGYWPLGKNLCHFYVSIDYTLCHVSILHMVFIAYARLRSLMSPKQYQNEFLISNAKLSMAGLWFISAMLWLPAVNLIINLSFRDRDCYFTFHPVYIVIQDIVAYLIPMFIILGITAYILQTLHQANKKRKNMRKKNIKIKSNPKINKEPTQKNSNLNNSNYLEAKSHHDNSSNAFSIINLKDSDRLSISGGSISNSDIGNDIKIQSFNIVYVNNSDESSMIQKTSTSVSPASPATNLKSFNLKSPSKIKTASSPKTQSKIAYKAFSKQESKLSAGISNNDLSLSAKSIHSFYSTEKLNLSCMTKIKSRVTLSKTKMKLNAYAKLYVIMGTFCVLWLPFCIIWPIESIFPHFVSDTTTQISYWMGYAQSLINPILLLILNPNYNKLKSEN